jgi:hypothetical protein
VSNGEGSPAGTKRHSVRPRGRLFTDVDEADAIVYAVNHGAKVINLRSAGSDIRAREEGPGLCG